MAKKVFMSLPVSRSYVPDFLIREYISRLTFPLNLPSAVVKRDAKLASVHVKKIFYRVGQSVIEKANVKINNRIS